MSRVRLPDGRAGILHGLLWQGMKCLEVWVMLDDYVEAKALPDQCETIKRDPAETIVYDETGTKFKLLPIELKNLERLRKDVWRGARRSPKRIDIREEPERAPAQLEMFEVEDLFRGKLEERLHER